MSKKINIGVLGCANIADRYVLPAIQSLKGNYKLVGVASRSNDVANKFASKFATNPFSSYQSLIESTDLDAVYIPLPNSLHYEWIKRALDNNLHVLVEKSLACNLNEVIELNEIAKRKNLVLLENFQFRFHPQLDLIKSIISSGAIGELRNIRSSFGFPPFKDKENIRYSKTLGGGALLDAGAYPLKVTQELIDQEMFVDAASLYICPTRYIDLWGNAQLKIRSSAVTSQISFGFDNYYQCALEIWGSKGWVKADRIFTCPPTLEAEVIMHTETSKEKIVVEKSNHFVNMLEHFYELMVNAVDREREYINNIIQARLIHDVKGKSDE